jgi:hypothetical protein
MTEKEHTAGDQEPSSHSIEANLLSLPSGRAGSQQALAHKSGAGLDSAQALQVLASIAQNLETQNHILGAMFRTLRGIAKSLQEREPPVQVKAVAPERAMPAGNDGRPAELIEAARVGRVDEITRLILSGASVRAVREHSGRTALHEAAHGKHEEACTALIAAGADPNARDAQWQTPLHLAAAVNGAGVARVLLAAGATPFATTRDGWTPLHTATVHNSCAFIKVLLERDAPVDIRNHWGRTPLHIAAIWGTRDVAEQLIAAGAQIQARDHDGLTPCDLAILNGWTEMSRQLASVIEQRKTRIAR